MTTRSQGARIQNTAWCSDAVRLAFVSRLEPEYGPFPLKVRSHLKAAGATSTESRTIETVTVTFTDHSAEQEPVVSTERVDQEPALDFPGGGARTIAFSALPKSALTKRNPALRTPGAAEVRQTSPYSGVSSLSCCRVLPVARGVVHAPR
jgi:hypothetical protein